MSDYELDLNDAAANGVVVAVLSGELDLTNARELEDRLRSAAAPEAVLVVDLNRVVFIDSAALHVLFKLARHRGNQKLALLVASDAAISRTLEIVGLKDASRVVGSLAELEAAPLG